MELEKPLVESGVLKTLFLLAAGIGLMASLPVMRVCGETKSQTALKVIEITVIKQ
jgi:hypothetical protein